MCLVPEMLWPFLQAHDRIQHHLWLWIGFINAVNHQVKYAVHYNVTSVVISHVRAIYKPYLLSTMTLVGHSKLQFPVLSGVNCH